MPNDVPDWTSGFGLLGSSVPDPQVYPALLDFFRRVHVVETPLHWFYPVGRVVYKDDFEDTLFKWQQLVGTVARDTTTAHFGSACAKLTTGAAAGNQATARKFFHLAADQGSEQLTPIAGRTIRVIVQAYFRWADNNQRRIYLRFFSDDTQTQREAWVVYHNRQAGIGQQKLEYLNSVGGTVAVGSLYPIDDGTATFLDCWHSLTMELDYNQGNDASGGYCYYHALRIDDQLVTFTPGTISSNQVASTGVRFTGVDIVLETDVAVASSAFVDDFFIADLSRGLNQYA